MNRYKYKLETHLEEISINNAEYKNLYSTWILNKESFSEVLDGASYNYPHYTLHDKSHSEKIITNIEMLLGEERIKKLSPTDTWLILNAAYLHDCGMTLLYDDILEDWSDESFQDYLKYLEGGNDLSLVEASRYILEIDRNKSEVVWPIKVNKYVPKIISSYYRGKHGRVSKEYILNKEKIGVDLKQNGLIHDRLVNLLAEISYIHTSDFEQVLRLNHISNGYDSDYVHPRFIGFLIRIGDLLDSDNNRFNPYMEKITGVMPKSSKVHQEKHKAIEHLLITPNSIEIRANCDVDEEAGEGSSEELYRETRSLFEWISEEIKNATINWNDIVPKDLNWLPPKLEEPQILLKGKVDEEDLANLKFNISQEKAFEIIEGSDVYSRKLVFLREFIQNALDTTKIQMWKDVKSGIYDSIIEKYNDKKIEYMDLKPYNIPEEVYNNYIININVEERGRKKIYDDLDELVIKIRDKGTGISIEDLKKICNVGESNSHKKIDKDMPAWLRPTASFGIGLQSAFLVNDFFLAKTKVVGRNTRNIEFRSAKKEGYLITREVEEKFTRGTEMRITINDFRGIGFKINSLRSLDIIKDNFDPFEEYTELENFILAEILSFIKESIIPIKFNDKFISSYSFYNKKDLNILDKFKEYKSQLYREQFKGSEYNENKDYIVHIEKDLSKIAIWYKKEDVLIIMLSLEGISLNGIDSLNFKDIDVDIGRNQIFKFPGYIREFNIYGFDTKSNLRLSRENLTEAGLSKFQDILTEVHKCLGMVLREYIENIDLKDIEKLNLLKANIICMIENEEKISDSSYNELKKLKLEVQCLIRKGNQFETGTKSIYELIEEINKFYFIVNISDYRNMLYKNNDEKYKMEELLRIINNDIKILDKHSIDCILMDEGIINNIWNKFDTLDYIFLNEIDNKKVILGRKYLKDENYINLPNEKNEREIIKYLGNMGNEEHKAYRNVIPSLKSYEKIGLSNGLRGLSYDYLYEFQIQGGKNIIISPFNRKIIEEQKINKYGEDDFLELTVSSKEYKNLIEYVENNNDYSINKEEIDKLYQKLIREYYNIVSEDI